MAAACRLLIAALAIAGMMPAAPASAAPITRVPAHPTLGMAIGPPRLYVSPGQFNKAQRVVIENRGSGMLRVHTQRSAFLQNANGSVQLTPGAPHSAVGWITVTPSSFQLRPRARRFVEIRVHVPRHPEPGDYQLAIVFLVPQPHGKGNIHIAAGIGVPVVITAPGPIVDRAHVVSLTAPGFSAGGSVPIAATIRDTGDVHHSFRGAGQQLTAIADGTPVLFPSLTLLRGSTVTFRTQWRDPPLLCLCHISTTITVGGRRSTVGATIVIFPVTKALAVVGVLIVIGLLFLITRRRQHRRLSFAYQAGLRGTASSGVTLGPARSRRPRRHSGSHR